MLRELVTVELIPYHVLQNEEKKSLYELQLWSCLIIMLPNWLLFKRGRCLFKRSLSFQDFNIITKVWSSSAVISKSTSPKTNSPLCRDSLCLLQQLLSRCVCDRSWYHFLHQCIPLHLCNTNCGILQPSDSQLCSYFSKAYTAHVCCHLYVNSVS